MSERKVTSQGHPDIVIIGPMNCVKVARRSDRVVWFASIAEYERWRSSNRHEALESIRSAVRVLAKDVACGAISDDMRGLLTWLADCSSVPTACELASRWSSRRSFFRTWASMFTCSPAKFLSRVRAAHARAMLRRGVTVREAAKRAGVRSASELYRLLRRWH